VLVVVALVVIRTRGQRSRHMGIFVGTILSFSFNEIGLGMRIGPYGKFDGICGIVIVGCGA
jgi:uncharacterized membrane protein YccC